MKKILLVAVMLLGLAALCVGCGGDSPSDAQGVGASNEDLAIGVYGECELPTPLAGLLNKVAHTLHSRGIEVSAEVILAYDHDLTKGDNTLELLFGGAAAWSLGEALGLEHSSLQGMLDEFGTEAGILASATVGLDFGGNWEGITFALDAYAGADIFAGSGGRWKVIWSSDPTEVGQEGVWAAVTVSSTVACKAGALVFASDDDLNVLEQMWNWLTGRGKSANTPLPEAGTSTAPDAGTDPDGGDDSDAGGDPNSDPTFGGGP